MEAGDGAGGHGKVGHFNLEYSYYFSFHHIYTGHFHPDPRLACEWSDLSRFHPEKNDKKSEVNKNEQRQMTL